MTDAAKPVGYLVWNPDAGYPSCSHGTFARAKAEAERLSTAYPGRRFYVMSPVKGLKGVEKATAFDEGHAEGVAQAHREIMLAESRSDRFSDEPHDLKRKSANAQAIIRQGRRFQAIVADCLLWFDGFAAAWSHAEAYERPAIPERTTLRALNAALQDLDPLGELDEEIPF